MMLQLGQFILDLDGELASRAKDDGLNTPGAEHVVFTEVLCDGQAECKGLATTSEIARNYIFSVVYWLETVLLNWEQVFNATSNKLLC